MTEKKRRKVGNYALLLGTLHRNPKIQRLSDRAFRAYINALSWSADQLSDGRVPLSAVPAFMPAAEPRARGNAITELQRRDEDDCALWYRVEPGVIEIHDYLEINASRAEIQANRKEQSRRAKARWEAGRNGAGDAAGNAAGTPAPMPPALPPARKRRRRPDAGGNAGGHAGSDASPCPPVPTDLKRSPPLVTATSARAHTRGTNGNAHVDGEGVPEAILERERHLAAIRAERSREGETSSSNPSRVRGPKLVPPDDGAADG